MSRVLAGPFLHTIWRPKVTGAEHVPASGGAILAANHQSVVDSVFLPLMMDRPVTFSLGKISVEEKIYVLFELNR